MRNCDNCKRDLPLSAYDILPSSGRHRRTCRECLEPVFSLKQPKGKDSQAKRQYPQTGLVYGPTGLCRLILFGTIIRFTPTAESAIRTCKELHRKCKHKRLNLDPAKYQRDYRQTPERIKKRQSEREARIAAGGRRRRTQDEIAQDNAKKHDKCQDIHLTGFSYEWQKLQQKERYRESKDRLREETLTSTHTHEKTIRLANGHTLIVPIPQLSKRVSGIVYLWDFPEVFYAGRTQLHCNDKRQHSHKTAESSPVYKHHCRYPEVEPIIIYYGPYYKEVEAEAIAFYKDRKATLNTNHSHDTSSTAKRLQQRIYLLLL